MRTPPSPHAYAGLCLTVARIHAGRIRIIPGDPAEQVCRHQRAVPRDRHAARQLRHLHRQTNDPNDPTARATAPLIGAGIGAVAGLLSGGDAVERRQRAMVGAGVGGLAGGAIGAYQGSPGSRAAPAHGRHRRAGEPRGDNITLNMPGNITFAFNSSNLDPKFYPVLDGVAQTLTEYNQTVVEVAGHTDNVGSEGQPDAVGAARDLGRELPDGRGLSQQRFIVTGAGESRPIASNDTEEGRAANRRVEITLVPVHQ